MQTTYVELPPVLPDLPESPELPPYALLELSAEPPLPLFASPVEELAPFHDSEPALPLPTAVDDPSAVESPP
jgi:hypothetical protein